MAAGIAAGTYEIQLNLVLGIISGSEGLTWISTSTPISEPSSTPSTRSTPATPAPTHARTGRRRAVVRPRPPQHLREAGFLDFALDERPLDAALVAQAVARQAGVVAVAWTRSCCPSLGLDVEGPIAVVAAESPGPAPVRSRPTPRSSSPDGDEAVLADLEPGNVPMAPVRGSDGRSAARRRQGGGCRTASRRGRAPGWRRPGGRAVVGLDAGALDLTVAYVTDRHGSSAARSARSRPCSTVSPSARSRSRERAGSATRRPGRVSGRRRRRRWRRRCAPPSGCGATRTSSRGRSASPPSTTCTSGRCGCRRW